MYTDAAIPLDETDRRIILASQDGLSLSLRPYDAVACEAQTDTHEVIRRMQRMMAAGIIRRIGVVPNHYRLGYIANGMTVWDVDDDKIAALGQRIGALDFVSHCYHRPRNLPDWPYNLFCMAHGHDRSEVEAHAEEIADILGDDCRAHEILYSTRILKKTGMRLVA
ncbi:MAG: siroheme decarboxylase subunit beta [Alphaproteobacteria bacterium]